MLDIYKSYEHTCANASQAHAETKYRSFTKDHKNKWLCQECSTPEVPKMSN